jgi:hypothetical protein
MDVTTCHETKEEVVWEKQQHERKVLGEGLQLNI